VGAVCSGGSPSTGAAPYRSANDADLRRNLARMLVSLGAAEYASQRAEHLRRGRSPRTLRYSPGDFHRSAVRTLGYGDSRDVARAIHSREFEPYLGRS
jgi:hypothetical protein